MRGTNIEHHGATPHLTSYSHVATCRDVQNRANLGGVHQHFAFGTYAGPRIRGEIELFKSGSLGGFSAMAGAVNIFR